MRFPEVRYERTSHGDYLELQLFDGTYRGVIFENDAAAMRALAPGRAEIDAVAVGRGFLPLGANRVSGAGVSPSLCEDDPDALAVVHRLASSSRHITPESNEAARQADPVESHRYDALAQSISR